MRAIRYATEQRAEISIAAMAKKQLLKERVQAMEKELAEAVSKRLLFLGVEETVLWLERLILDKKPARDEAA